MSILQRLNYLFFLNRKYAALKLENTILKVIFKAANEKKILRRNFVFKKIPLLTVIHIFYFVK